MSYETILEEDYTIKYHSGSIDQYEVEGSKNNYLPFRYSIRTPQNLRGQTTEKYYKTFIGDQKV